MAASASTSRPNWQRNPVFRFFASLKLAVVLLAVLIIGAIAGTLYESSFDAKVARAYVYGAPWFNVWLLFLAANLAVSALSRWAQAPKAVGPKIDDLRSCARSAEVIDVVQIDPPTRYRRMVPGDARRMMTSRRRRTAPPGR